MSLIERYRNRPGERPAGSLEDAVFIRSVSDVVAAKVAEKKAEIQAKADASVEEANKRAKKAEDEAEASATKRFAEKLDQAEARQREAERMAQRAVLEKATAEGSLKAERAAREQAEERLRAESKSVEGLRRELEKARAAPPVVNDKREQGALSALATRIESAVSSLKVTPKAPVSQGFDFQFHVDGGGNIVGATATPRKA